MMYVERSVIRFGDRCQRSERAAVEACMCVLTCDSPAQIITQHTNWLTVKGFAGRE